MKRMIKRWIGTAAVVGIAATSVACKDSQQEKLEQTYKQQQRELKRAYKGAKQALRQRHKMAQQELKTSRIKQAYTQARSDLRKRHKKLDKRIQTLAKSVQQNDAKQDAAKAMKQPIKALREQSQLISKKLDASKPTMLTRKEFNAWRESLTRQLSSLAQEIEKTRESIQSTD